jgi:hypothetical protein
LDAAAAGVATANDAAATAAIGNLNFETMDRAITLPSPEECPGKKMSRARRPRKGAGARLDSTRRHPSSSDRKLARIQLFKS